MQLLSRNELILGFWASTVATCSFLSEERARPISTVSLPTTPPLAGDAWQAWAQQVRSATIHYLDSQEPTGVRSAALIRLAFHDAVTGRPNASIRYELEWSENRALSQPLSIVQDIFDNTRMSSKIGSLADTIALAGTQAIEYTGGPRIAIQLGRTDAVQADPYRLATPLMKDTKRSLVTRTMPDAGLDSDGLRLYFGRLGLDEAEWVALSGVHGLGRHVSLLGMDKACLKELSRACLEDAPVLLPFVTSSVDRFSNDYFQALLRWNTRQVQLGEVAFLPTDVALVVDAGLRRHVQIFAKDEGRYRRTFRRAWQRLVESTATTKAQY